MVEARMRTVICDDEPLARSTLRRLVADDPELELVAECSSGKEALAAVKAHAPDLLLLDVQMPGMDGFQVVEALQNGNGHAASAVMPLVLFATAYDRFALKAFDVHAVDYLLKPFDDERFRDAIERAKSHRKLERVAKLSSQLSALLDTMRGALAVPSSSGRYLDRLSITHTGTTQVVGVADIVWIEAADQYVLIHTVGGTEHLMRESIAYLESRLDPARFVRIHRSAIVALAHIKRFDREPTGIGKVLVGKDTWLPVSRTRTALLRARLT
jgi:two-component system, LytTR family, response regulator